MTLAPADFGLPHVIDYISTDFTIESVCSMSSEEIAQSRTSKDTGYIAGDDGWTRWRNTFALLLGRMNDEGKAQYRKARDDRWEADDCERCDKYKEHLLAYSKPCSPPTGPAFPGTAAYTP